MRPWMWAVLWGAVIVVLAGLWLRERSRNKGWAGSRSDADPRGASDARMRLHMRDSGQGTPGGV